jgi:hypothetical protein
MATAVRAAAFMRRHGNHDHHQRKPGGGAGRVSAIRET